MCGLTVEIKKEQEIAHVLDQKHNALWSELSKCHMVSTDGYTTGIIDEQVRLQDREIELRYASVSQTRNTIKSLLEESTSIYDTASCGVHVLADVVCHAERAKDQCSEKVECAKRKREGTIYSAKQKVASRKMAMQKLCEEKVLAKERFDGLEKLTSLLHKLKVDEDAQFASVQANVGGTAFQIKNKESAGDDLRSRILRSESQCDVGRERLMREKEVARALNINGLKAAEELAALDASVLETAKQLAEQRNEIERLRSSYSSGTAQLQLLREEFKTVREKLTAIDAEFTGAETRAASDIASWKDVCSYKTNNNSLKLSKIGGQVAAEKEELHQLDTQLEALRTRINTADKGTFSEERWRDTLQEESDELAGINSELLSSSAEIDKLRGELADSSEENKLAEATLALERDFLALSDQRCIEGRNVHELRKSVLTRTNYAQEHLKNVNALCSARTSEHAKLVADLSSLQAQLDAFTSLCTPSKPAGVSSEATLLRTLSRGRRASRVQQIEVDSDDGSSPSGVPEIDGLQPFSPATISLKEQRRGLATRHRKVESDVRGVKEVEKQSSARVDSANEAPVICGVSSPQGAQPRTSSGLRRDAELKVIRIGSDSSASSSPSQERLDSKRFPDDIFLKKTPSIDPIDSAASPNVSTNDTLMEGDADQSVWSCASPPRPATALDSTFDTDLDQSIW